MIGKPLGRDSREFQAARGATHDVGVTYDYQGRCPRTGIELRLPRTRAVESVARELMESLPALGLAEGKMFGVLLVRDRQGQIFHGKAFSGTLDGSAHRDGWAPPFAPPMATPLEERTLAELERWKRTLARIQAEIDAHSYPAWQQDWIVKQSDLRERHRVAKAERATARQMGEGRGVKRDLDAESRHEGRQWRQFRQTMDSELSISKAEYEALQSSLNQGRAARRETSRTLQAEMHQQFALGLWSALGCQLDALFPQGVPTGTGDCCAPKLLAWASEQEYEPLALAEFWWGPTSVGGKQSEQFYPACRERCQPMMGPLLALALRPRIALIHQDDDIVVVDKPSGLLTVPGRYHWNQDSLLGRLRRRWAELRSVHRLDMDTSGLVVLARNPESQAALQKQFAERSVGKTYHALLAGLPGQMIGTLEAALGPDPERPGCYRPDSQGKAAITSFRVLDVAQAKVELRPRTGRSHQLRVHMAQALGTPIRGDRLYGALACRAERLMLHATRLEFDHPKSGRRLCFEAETPF